jgi:hypothetical protein
MDSEYTHVDGEIVKRSSEGEIIVTIPGTKIHNNREYLGNLNYFQNLLMELGFRVAISVRIPDHLCLDEKSYELSSSFVITEFVRGNRLPFWHKTLKEGNDKKETRIIYQEGRVVLEKCNYDAIVEGKEYISLDRNSFYEHMRILSGYLEF